MKLGITGHRPPGLGCGYEIPNPTYEKIHTAIMGKFHELKPTVIYTGMAQGTDQWAAWIAIELEIPFVACLPCDEMNRTWPKEATRKFEHILSLAKEVINVSPGPYAPKKMHIRDRFIVENTDIMLAVYDGRKTGGTYSTVRSAEKRSKDVVVINPNDL